MRRFVRSPARMAAPLAGALVVISMLLASTTPALAIPAFARKYQTSCQTCHIAFPALTPFGEGFRLNGYRFPAGTDPSVTKQDPVALGSDGYKKLWPKAVWPGEIPGLPPLSVVVQSDITYSKADKMTTFDNLAGELALITGGTLGDHVSFYGELTAARENGETVTELQRVNILFRPLATPAFQFKIGAFEPGLFLASNLRRMTQHENWVTNGEMLPGDNQWSPEEFQQGIEFFGVVARRILYNAGYVEGSGNASNNAKDVYGRIAYKIGGMTFDCTTKGVAETGMEAMPKPWSEKSFTISAFIYKGNPRLSRTDTVQVLDPNTLEVNPEETTLAQDDRFTYYGGDVQWNFMDLIARAGATGRLEHRPFLDNPGRTDLIAQNRFVELNWVALPWLVPATRWESFEFAGDKTQRISLTVQFLVRANVRSFLATDWINEPGHGRSYDTEEYVGGLVFGL